MMNPQSSPASRRSPSDHSAQKATVIEAAKQKKIIEFQIYKNDKGRSYTQKVVIRKSTHRYVERSNTHFCSTFGVK